jgi:hypothetical protein
MAANVGTTACPRCAHRVVASGSEVIPRIAERCSMPTAARRLPPRRLARGRVGLIASVGIASSCRASAIGRDAMLVAGGFMAARCDRQVQGDMIESARTRTRPKPASRVAPKRPDCEPSLFLFHFYEAAVRDLTHPATSSHSSSSSKADARTHRQSVLPQRKPLTTRTPHGVPIRAGGQHDKCVTVLLSSGASPGARAAPATRWRPPAPVPP